MTAKNSLHRLYSFFLALGFCFFHLSSNAQDAKALFQNNCATCHAPTKDLTGPALAGIRDRVTDKKLLFEWVRNNKKVLASGDPYFTKIYEKWNKTPMNLFPSLTDNEIEAIFDYVDKAAAAAKSPAKDDGMAKGALPNDNGGDSGIWLYVLIFVAIVALIFLFRRINYNLEKSAAQRKKQTIASLVPIYRDKRYWVFFGIVATVLFGVFIANEGISSGLQQNYQPKQPIFFSHRVHSGINKIECVYCHSSASKSKHSSIPTVNVCMNCHKAINEYSGGLALVTKEGEEIDGSAEIKKLYKYAGFETGKPWNPENGKPIVWQRVHNLPDHVKFFHAQHVSVGNIACQTCHGQVQEMDEVYQYNTLSMGWCVNCHRETEVQFANNNFYQMYEKLHRDFKNGDKKKITVSDIGGTECQRCHY